MEKHKKGGMTDLDAIVEQCVENLRGWSPRHDNPEVQKWFKYFIRCACEEAIATLPPPSQVKKEAKHEETQKGKNNQANSRTVAEAALGHQEDDTP